jgi:uncharacterized protein (TIGR02246 family)
MRTSTRFAVAVLLAAAALVSAGGAAAQSAAGTSRAADEAAIKAVVQAFLDTREANDTAGLSALLSADVDQQQTSGNVRRGRDAVVAGIMQTQRDTGGKRTIAVESLRFLTDDVAIADGRYLSVGRADGTDQLMLTAMVMRREAGTWKIAAIRNLRPPAPAAR